MSMGKQGEKQEREFWIVADEVAEAPGRPFYERLNSILQKQGFDQHVHEVIHRRRDTRSPYRRVQFESDTP